MATLQERYDSGTIATRSGVADMVLLETQKITQWAADVVYNQNQVVYAITGSGGHNFMSLVNNNVGNPVTDTSKWQDLGVGGLNQTNVGKAMRFKDLAEQVVAKNAALTAVTNGGNADAQHVHSLDAISEKNDIMLKSVYATNTDGVMVDKAATVNVPGTAASGDAYVVGTDGTASFEHRTFVPDGSVSNQFLGNVSGNLQWVNKTDIITVVDSLDGTDGTMALSAYQGYILNSLIDAIIPKGTITAYGGSTIPSGWLLCDGSWVSQTTYAALYAAIANIYDWASESSEHPGDFKLPDLRGRFLEGCPAGQTFGAAVAAGLPEIAGRFGSAWARAAPGSSGQVDPTGALSGGVSTGAITLTTQTPGVPYVNAFSAAASNSIYGASETVQPPAALINYIIKC